MTKKYHYVYKTSSITTPHFYYGVHSTNNLNDTYVGSGIKFKNFMKKYGRDAFKREIVQQFDTGEEAFQYERELLTEDVLTNEFA